MQTVKDVRGSQDTLVDVFERIESFIRRLEIYAEVRPTTEMTETIVLIMVEVISILGIATKEINLCESRSSSPEAWGGAPAWSSAHGITH